MNMVTKAVPISISQATQLAAMAAATAVAAEAKNLEVADEPEGSKDALVARQGGTFGSGNTRRQCIAWSDVTSDARLVPMLQALPTLSTSQIPMLSPSLLAGSPEKVAAAFSSGDIEYQV